MRNLTRVAVLCLCIHALFCISFSQVQSPVDLGKRVLTWNEAVDKWIAEFPGKPAPDFEFTQSSGDHYRLTDLGDRLILLDFWASWCWVCIEDIPKLKKVRDDYAGRIVLIGINHDVKNAWTQDSLATFVKKTGLTWPQVLDAERPLLTDKYGTKFYPSYIVVRSGRIIACHWKIDEIRSILDQELKRQ